MEHFDQLIKEKVESQHFDYQASAWKLLCKKMGISRISLPAKIAIIATTTSAVIVSTLLVLHFAKPQNNNANSLNINNLEETSPITTIDTIEKILEDTLPLRMHQETEKTTIVATTVQEPEKPQEITPTISQDSALKSENQTVTPIRKKPKEQQWKVSIIDVDTIR